MPGLPTASAPLAPAQAAVTEKLQHFLGHCPPQTATPPWGLGDRKGPGQTWEWRPARARTRPHFCAADHAPDTRASLPNSLCRQGHSSTSCREHRPAPGLRRASARLRGHTSESEGKRREAKATVEKRSPGDSTENVLGRSQGCVMCMVSTETCQANGALGRKAVVTQRSSQTRDPHSHSCSDFPLQLPGSSAQQALSILPETRRGVGAKVLRTLLGQSVPRARHHCKPWDQQQALTGSFRDPCF